MRVLRSLLLFSLTLWAKSQVSQGAHDPCSSRSVPQFIDVTPTAKISFQHSSDPIKRYIFESMSGGVLLIDYDRDGWPDVYFTNAPTQAMLARGEMARSALYRNNHDGTFTDVTEKAGVAFPCAVMGGAVGDYNNDGWPDMLLTCLRGSVLYRNNGDGTFTDVTARAGLSSARWNTGAAFADFDGDGFLDLAITSYVELDLKHLPQPGSATTCLYRGVPVQCGPHGLKGGDDALFHGNGDGTFTDISQTSGLQQRNGYFGLGLLWSDFDGTGRPSLFIAHDSTPNTLYQNVGNGRFKEIALDAGVAVNADGKEQANMGVAVGDYLHSGRPSIYVTTFSDEVKPLYRNDGQMQFSEVASNAGLASPSLPLLGWGTSFADFDNDGWLDLLTVYGHVYPQVDGLRRSGGYRETKTLFLSQGEGSFCDVTSRGGAILSEATAARGLATGDLFNDGNIDAVIENIDGSPLVLRNQGLAGRHWIELELVGTKSNRLAIGAEVTLSAAGTVQTAEVHSGGSYLSQNDLRVHFGIGAATEVSDLQIRWPSKEVETIHRLRADHIYSVLEGSGVVERGRTLPVRLKVHDADR